jgi:hypothetical protein
MEIFRKDLATGLAMILAAAIGLAAFPGECLAQKPSGGIGKSAMIGKNMAIFYPEGFKASEMLPSMALLKEPGEEGAIPSGWKVFPDFMWIRMGTIASGSL